jgi:hypothetical protein
MIEKSYLVSVGVEDYYDQSFGKVTYAEADAKAISDAFKKIGLPDSQSKTLFGKTATKGIVLHELNNVTGLANSGDRIYVYYAGHGLSHNSQNYITFHDSSKSQPETTCLKLNDILAILESSRCKQVILFLDCCHSGLSMAGLRDSTSIFDTSALIYEHRTDTFLVGFAACGHNETSSPSNKYGHGIWTQHLLNALNGVAEHRVYTAGVLTSSSLQEFLRSKTSEDARTLFDQKRIQSPERFGKDNGDFIVADVSLHFKKHEAPTVLVRTLEISSVVERSIKQLPGFIKGSHSVPTGRSRATIKFVHSIGTALLEEVVSDVAIKAKKAFGYKLSQAPKAEVADGVGTVVCLDFDFQVSIDQSEDSPSDYTLEKKAYNFKLREGYSVETIDAVLGKSVDSLFLLLKNPPKVESLIEAIESTDGTKVRVDYDPSNLSYCDVDIVDTGKRLRFNSQGIELYSLGYEFPSEIVRQLEGSFNRLVGIPEIIHLKIE